MTERRIKLDAAGFKAYYKSTYYNARIAYGFSDRFEVYGRIGAADLDGKVTYGGATAELSGSSRLAWGLGAQGILYDAGKWNLGGDATYFAHSGHKFGAVNITGVDWAEWHIAAVATGTFEQIHPYGGVRYSDFKVNADGYSGSDKAKNKCGVFAGLGFAINDQWSAYGEGRFIDETAFGGGVRYTF